MSAVTERVKLTVAFPADVHAATTDLAARHRRSFTAEVVTALDEHLAANGVTPDAPPTLTTHMTEETR